MSAPTLPEELELMALSSNMPGIHTGYLVDLLHRAAAALSREWLPMETAPKDGTEIVALIAERDGYPQQHGYVLATWGEDRWHSSITNWDSSEFAGWQPLPPPPARSGSGETR